MSLQTQSIEALGEHVEIVDRRPWLALVEERFGIEAAAFDDFLVVRPNSHSLHLVARDHLPPRRPAPQVIGMSFLRTRMRHPKLSTAAAMCFGHLATKNALALSDEQADAFLRREPIALNARQRDVCGSTGYIIARIEEVVLGVGFVALQAGELRSMFPKAWKLEDDTSAFSSSTPTR